MHPKAPGADSNPARTGQPGPRPNLHLAKVPTCPEASFRSHGQDHVSGLFYSACLKKDFPHPWPCERPFVLPEDCWAFLFSAFHPMDPIDLEVREPGLLLRGVPARHGAGGGGRSGFLPVGRGGLCAMQIVSDAKHGFALGVHYQSGKAPGKTFVGWQENGS